MIVRNSLHLFIFYTIKFFENNLYFNKFKILCIPFGKFLTLYLQKHIKPHVIRNILFYIFLLIKQ